MKRIINREFLDDYAAVNDRCEVAPYFAGPSGIIVYRMKSGQRILDQYTMRRHPIAEQVHHILGSGNGCARHDVLTNVVHVSMNAHNWLENWKIAGQVVCFWTKKQKGELDWEFLSAAKGKQLPGWLETDQVIDECRQFLFVETMRRSLIQ